MVNGINHITFAVRDLDKSLAFYQKVLGLSVAAVWAEGAYLQAGSTWIALNLDLQADTKPPCQCSHIAFHVEKKDFDPLAERIRRSGATIWQENKSEGASLYFTDPDCHKLEIHASDLAARLYAMELDPPKGYTAIFQTDVTRAAGA